jgi:hypothetical protein
MRVRSHHATSTLLDATGQTVRFMYRLGNICATCAVETVMRLWRWIAQTITRSLAPLVRALTCWNPPQVAVVPLGGQVPQVRTVAHSAMRGHIADSHGIVTAWPACQRAAGLERRPVTVAARGVAAYGWPGRGDVSAWMPGPPGSGSRARMRSRVGAHARDCMLGVPALARRPVRQVPGLLLLASH